jgi:hypothetical protein
MSVLVWLLMKRKDARKPLVSYTYIDTRCIDDPVTIIVYICSYAKDSIAAKSSYVSILSNHIRGVTSSSPASIAN